MKQRAATATLLLLGLLLVSAANAATVVYVGSAGADPTTRLQIQAAAQFYGLDLVAFRPENDQTTILRRLRDPETVALVLDARALPLVNRQKIFSNGSAALHLPVLVAGVRAEDSAAALKLWSGGAVVGAAQIDIALSDAASYKVGDVPGITLQLSGTSMRMMPRSAAPYLVTGSGGQSILEVVGGGKNVPVFLRTANHDGEVFFAAQGQRTVVPVTPDPYRQQSVFAGLAPAMMFLRHAAGDRAWHAPGSYANLTIDDVWLREPYGNVNYEGLLHAMEGHRFHTTMAFIPWNYDRNEPAMVALFAAHPDLFSICIHGNNHVHQEFGPLATHPLSKQVEDMRQAVARMERFRELTGIPYDRVMVFPHSVAPLATLAELKRANYQATANSLNVPFGADPTSEMDVALRTTTLQYANFPSMRRYSAETDIPTAQLAIDLFLGNPTLFYIHEGFFAEGMDRFDPLADRVNHLDPATQWRSLGYIASHSYLERARSDGGVDIRLFTASADIQNKTDHRILYHIEKSEDFALPVSALVDGKPFPFQRQGNLLLMETPVEGGQSGKVNIQYGEPLHIAAIDISKGSLSVAVIRHLSDFRDDVVSRTAIGRRFIASYADHGSTWNIAAAAAISVVLVILLLRSLIIRSVRRNRAVDPVASSISRG